MKCFSLVADGYVVNAGIPGVSGMGAYYITDAYPQAKPGLELDEDGRTLKVSLMQGLCASDKLLRLPPERGAIERKDEVVSVLRASIEGEGAGAVLVPEYDDDTENALVNINVGPGHYQFVRYRTGETQVLKHLTIGGEGHERLLVVLKPFEPIVAVRSAKRWIFWGAEQVKELLTIRFDGQDLYYEVQRVRG